MDIGVFKRVLNSGELECYEFLVGIREVNSWVDLGELLIDVFNMRLDLSSGEVYMNSVSYVDFVRVYTSMLIKYLSYDSTVVYGFNLPYNKTFNMYIISDFGIQSYVIEFKEKSDDLINGHNNYVVLQSSNIYNCRITDIDRVLGMLDFGIGISDIYKPTVIIKYVDVDLDILRLQSFRYLGEQHANGITMHRESTWVLGYLYKQKQKSKVSDMIQEVSYIRRDLPF